MTIQSKSARQYMQRSGIFVEVITTMPRINFRALLAHTIAMSQLNDAKVVEQERYNSPDRYTNE